MLNYKMAAKPKVKEKLITLSPELFNVLSADAIRCKRSVNKQIEAILSAYADVEAVELNSEAVETARSVNNFKPKGNKLQNVEAVALEKMGDKKSNNKKKMVG